MYRESTFLYSSKKANKNIEKGEHKFYMFIKRRMIISGFCGQWDNLRKK